MFCILLFFAPTLQRPVHHLSLSTSRIGPAARPCSLRHRSRPPDRERAALRAEALPLVDKTKTYPGDRRVRTRETPERSLVFGAGAAGDPIQPKREGRGRRGNSSWIQRASSSTVESRSQFLVRGACITAALGAQRGHLGGSLCRSDKQVKGKPLKGSASEN